VLASSVSSLIMTADIYAFAAPAAHGLPPLLGNRCRVNLVKEPPGDSPPNDHHLTCCTSWPRSGNSAGVACWNGQGISIQCCGHGLLSCASVWMERWGGNGHLIMSGTQVDCRKQGQLTWLGFPPAIIEEQSCPGWITALLGVSVSGCATIGGEDGYLIVQLSQDSDLSLLSAPDAGMAKMTRRALIVTCEATRLDKAYDEDIHFRYFAPQYGEPEDSATGSAMRLLASYWYNRGLGRHLRALQRSARGGLLASTLAEGTTWVGGLTLREDEVSA